MPYSTQAHNWLDTTLYPFQHKYIDLKAGKMHYVDEGDGEVILFIHGTPTWSFLYRRFIQSLSYKYRCVAPDHIGFGLSDKPKNFNGTPRQHMVNLSELVEKLDLQNITLVVHDFGGPVGLGFANQYSDRIKRIVLFNSWLWATDSDPDAQKADKILNGVVGKFLYLQLNFSPKVLLKKGFADKQNLSKRVHSHYTKPFPDKTSRLSLLNIGKSLVGSSDWYEEQWKLLSALEQKPWLILWGMKDPFFSQKHLDKWKKRLPQAHIEEFNSGHFVQEEAGKESIGALIEFLES